MKKHPTKNDVLKKYLSGDLKRFLKRVYRSQRNELIFSKFIPQLEKENPGLRKQIFKHFRGQFPGNIAESLNVHKVMVKHYGFVNDIEDIIISSQIENVLFTEIQAHRIDNYRRRVVKLSLLPKKHSPKQALKELKARGFIHINDFEDYDKNMAHIKGNINLGELGSKLFYPLNFPFQWSSRAKLIHEGNHKLAFVDVYIAHGAIGVSGYTQVVTPGNSNSKVKTRKSKKKRR